MRPDEVVEAKIVDPDWTFSSTVRLPNDTWVDVTATVPDRQAGSDVMEVGEHVQMAASRVAGALKAQAPDMPF